MILVTVLHARALLRRGSRRQGALARATRPKICQTPEVTLYQATERADMELERGGSIYSKRLTDVSGRDPCHVGPRMVAGFTAPRQPATGCTGQSDQANNLSYA